jgi:hypothetical protein
MTELHHIHKDGFINEEQLKNIESFEANKLFSIHWELRTILYLGVLLLTSGIGILVYINIDSIGHQAILAAIAIACCACFYYVHKHKLPYQNVQTVHASPFFDYVVLLGCLLFALFIGYFQYQYGLLGNHYGLLVFIPSIVSFYLAYRFDHKGVLSIAISGLTSAFGLTVTPRQLLEANDFSDLSVIITALALGSVLGLWVWYSNSKNIKPHFSFTYSNFSLNLLFIGVLSALFGQDFKILSLLLLLALCFYFIKHAIAQHSYLFLLLTVLYSYIGVTYYLFYLLSKLDSMNEGVFMLGMLYVILSAVGVIFFFINMKKIVGHKNESI